MFTHDPSCLEGPVADWWFRSNTGLAETAELAEVDPQPFVADNRSAVPELPMRFALVARIRREIAAGIYETPEKWEAALKKLWQCLPAR